MSVACDSITSTRDGAVEVATVVDPSEDEAELTACGGILGLTFVPSSSISWRPTEVSHARLLREMQIVEYAVIYLAQIAQSFLNDLDDFHRNHLIPNLTVRKAERLAGAPGRNRTRGGLPTR